MDYKQNPTNEWLESVRARFPTETTVDETLTRKMKKRSSETYTPSTTAEIQDLLVDFFQAEAPSSTVSNVRPLGGGASKEQYCFDLVDSQQQSTTYVLRREPPESIVETHRLREFQIMNAMGKVVPVPEAVWVDVEGTHFRRPALISKFVGGVTKEASSDSNVSGIGTDFSENIQKQLGGRFVDLLARIHLHDWRNDELDAFDKPEQGTNSGVISIINQWERVWEEDSYEAYPIIKLASHWLRQNAPSIDRVTVVHHDFRASNFLFDPSSYEINAVLDWELAHLGDYHEDLAWTLQRSYGYYDDAGRFYVCGLMEENEFLNLYESLTGFRVDRQKLAYYSIMNAWKAAIIVLGTAVRCTIGAKTHQDILLSWITGIGPTCVDELNQLLKKALFN